MAGTSVAIVDSGGANIASLSNAFDRLGVSSVRTRDASTIANAGHVVLPGVGTAADAMRRLQEHHLVDTIANLKQPVLGICLGMQLFAQSSEEDGTPCLAIVPASVRKLAACPQEPVPNMGWCKVTPVARHELFSGIEDNCWFYFAHSFALDVGDHTVATAVHREPFTAVLAHRNFIGAQFHPERSAQGGSRFLRNFLELGS